MDQAQVNYYVPEQSKWPIIGAIGLFCMGVGAAATIHGSTLGKMILIAGLATIVTMMFGWFRNIIKENAQGLMSVQLHKSYRLGMLWFIFSEVAFFGILFGVLFYTRNFSVEWLAGASNNAMTHNLLWPEFQAAWPLLVNPDNQAFKGASQLMVWSGIPLWNTLLLISSSFTLHIAHHALKDGLRQKLNIFLGITIVLGLAFLVLQAVEYSHAYSQLNLTMDSGIYGSTFFILTGFHGLHVTIGTIMLTVMFFRCMRGSFSNDNHFAFEASAWYWHFVDVVWLCLFLFVYII